jgi:hypothetical protein
MGFWKSLGKIAKVAAPVIIGAAMPQAVVNTALAGVAKHTPLISNQTIPVLNLAVSTGVSYFSKAIDTGDWVAPILPALQEGGVLTGMSTALHQALKIPMAETFNGSLAKKVGPGDRFSI